MSERLALPPALSEVEVVDELGRLAAKNRPMVQMIGLGLLRHLHASGDPAPGAGEPWLVHRLHPVSARDQPGTPRGAAQLPDHGRGPHRASDGERLAARRGNGSGRGDDHGGPGVPHGHTHWSSMPTCSRRRSRCSQTRARPLGIEIDVRDLRTEGLPTGDIAGLVASVPSGERSRPRPRAPDRRSPRAGGAGDRHRRPAGADHSEATR